MSDFCTKGSNEEILVDLPTSRSGLDIEVDFLIGATAIEIVDRFVARNLSNTTVLHKESFRVRISHPQEFL